jgi:hypothetical protein
MVNVGLYKEKFNELEVFFVAWSLCVIIYLVLYFRKSFPLSIEFVYT